MKKFLPGVLLAIFVSICGKVLSGFFPGPGTISLAIIVGILLGNLFAGKDSFVAGINFGEKKILPIAISLMGLELEVTTLGKLGFSSFVIIIPSMAIAILASFLIGRKMGFSSSLAILLGVGNSVCGSSAIIASAPTVKASKDEIGVSVSAVNLMGTVGIFLMPFLAHLIPLNELNTSYLIGGTLQAVGQVVAAGFSVSDSVGDTATIVKMLRVLMIGPVIVILAMIFNTKEKGKGKRNYVPGYIWGFMGFVILGAILEGDRLLIKYLKYVGKWLLIVSMASVGLKIHFRSLIKQGPKAIFLVSVLSFLQVSTVLMLMFLVF